MDELEELTVLLFEELSELRAELAALRELTTEILPSGEDPDSGENSLQF